MAIILCGKTRCAICGNVLQATDKNIGFSALFPNENDPLHLFNDSGVHAECFKVHPLRKAAEKRVAEYKEKTGPGHRFCFVCGREIAVPDDYLGFGHLTDDPAAPLAEYNYAHFHRSCFRDWSKGSQVFALLEEMVETGVWRGGGLPVMIEDLKGLLRK